MGGRTRPLVVQVGGLPWEVVSCTRPLMAWSGSTSPGRAGELLWSFCPSLYNDRCRVVFC